MLGREGGERKRVWSRDYKQGYHVKQLQISQSRESTLSNSRTRSLNEGPRVTCQMYIRKRLCVDDVFRERYSVLILRSFEW